MSEQASLPSWPDILPTMFHNPLFQQIDPYIFRANINGTRGGVAVASRNRKFFNHALNKDDMDRVLEAKRTGKIAAAFVVAARVSVDHTFIYVGYRDAEELYESLKDVPPLKSAYGLFWVLRPNLTPLGVTTSDDDDDFDF